MLPSHHGAPGPRSRHEAELHALLDRLQEHDAEAYDHSRRVASLARDLALQGGMNDRDVVAAYTGGLVHDIGLLFVPAPILRRRGVLTPVERDLIRRHPEQGHGLVASLIDDARVRACVLGHHEQPDGHGYPSGARRIDGITAIVAVADTCDTVMNKRWQLGTVEARDALAELERVAGRQLMQQAVRLAQRLFA